MFPILLTLMCVFVHVSVYDHGPTFSRCVLIAFMRFSKESDTQKKVGCSAWDTNNTVKVEHLLIITLLTSTFQQG